MSSTLDEEWQQMKLAWHPSRPSSNPPHRDYNLGLGSLWYSSNPVGFPPPSMKLKPSTFNAKISFDIQPHGTTFDHTMYNVIYIINTMITTRFRVTWNSSNLLRTVKAKQMHTSPRILTIEELQLYRDRYSENLAKWAEAQKGSLVGDGECWTLAADGLEAIGAMRSPGYWHGYLLQIFHGHFKTKEGGRKVVEPGHTSIIVRVDYNGVLYVLEGNATPNRKVVDGEYDLRQMIKGEIRIFRAVSKNWSGEELVESK